jgi:hypothetical protein
MPTHDDINAALSRPLTRRQALAAGGAAALALSLGARAAEPDKPRSRVIDIRSERWRDATGKQDAVVVKQMLDDGLVKLTGAADAAAAWKQVFGKFKVVGVKFNSVSRNFSRTNQLMVDLLTAGLLSAGLERGNIIVVEAVGAHFEGGGQPQPGWAGEYDFGSGKTRLSNFIVNQVDAILNVPDLKDHERTGITGAIKNLSHARNTVMEDPQRFHANACDPYVADLYNLEPIRTKPALHVMNGLRAMYDRGPVPNPAQWPHNGLLLAFDPCAIDKVALDLVVAERRKRGLPELDHRGTPPTFLDTAVKRGLGTNDPARIEVVKATV